MGVEGEWEWRVSGGLRVSGGWRVEVEWGVVNGGWKLCGECRSQWLWLLSPHFRLSPSSPTSVASPRR